MKKLKPLSLSSHTFADIRNSQAIYVDKTLYIHTLIDAYPVNKYFLSRPRRFGKSLTLSTLKALFSGQKDLFKDLYITKETNYDFQVFPVLHFDFSKVAHGNATELTQSLTRHILQYATQYSCDIPTDIRMSDTWDQLISFFKQKQQKIVILIDEYDKPILDHITNLPIAKDNRDVLKSFYEIIKANDESLRFVFITGITKFSQMNIFSGLNNLTDISLDTDYATLCGYTQHELETYFSDYLDIFAAQENISKQALLEKIKTWYNGFRFTEKPTTLYNPYSTLSLLRAKSFQYHWFATGTPTYLFQLLKQFHIDVQNLPKKLSINDTASYNVENLNVNLPALLFQTGYMTITGLSPSGEVLLLDYPNLEVKEAFTQQLIDMLASPQLSPAVTIDDLREALYNHNLNEVFSILSLFFAKIPYDIHEPTEKYYQSLFYLIFTVIGTRIRAEVRTHKGRIDALVETDHHLYLFEFKLLRDTSTQTGTKTTKHTKKIHTATKDKAIQRVLAEALAQIDAKDYLLPFQDSTKIILKIPAVFAIEERNIVAWLTVPHP